MRGAVLVAAVLAVMALVGAVALFVVAESRKPTAGDVTLYVENATATPILVHVGGWVLCADPPPRPGPAAYRTMPGETCRASFVVAFDWDDRMLCVTARSASDESFDVRLTQREVDEANWHITISERHPRLAPSSMPGSFPVCVQVTQGFFGPSARPYTPRTWD